MEKKKENPYVVSVEDSSVSSNCSVFEIDHDDWPTYERIRLIKKGKDINKFVISADPDFNEGSVCCEDYTMKFNRDECAIDLVINSEKGSPVWKDVIKNVPVQFASFLNCKPETFLYRIYTNTSEIKPFYCFDPTYDEGASLLCIGIDELGPLGDYKSKYFDSLVESMSNIF